MDQVHMPGFAPDVNGFAAGAANNPAGKLASAQALAAIGPVFPIMPGAKAPPLIEMWQHRATRSADQIDHWWMVAYPEANIGVVMGRGNCCIDLDTKNGVDGIANWRALDQTQTLTFITPTGGRHLIFADPEGIVTGTASELAPGVDTKGHHGYIVGAGSVIDGRPYKLLYDAPIAPLPAFLADHFRAKAQRRSETRKSDYTGAWDLGPDQELAWHWIELDLAQNGPPLDGAKDGRAIVMANRLLDLPLTEATVAAMLHELWCPNHPLDWMQTKVANAAASRQNDQGCEHWTQGSEMLRARNPDIKVADTDWSGEPVLPDSILRYFGEDPAGARVDDASNSATTTDAMSGLAGSTAMAVLLECGLDVEEEEVSWLWPGWLARGKLHILAGEKGAGKSTIAFDWMARASAGKPWPDNSL